MKIKTAELTGAALDWAVAKCVGSDPEITQYGGTTALRFEHRLYSPSTDWATGGPIIEWRKITLGYLKAGDSIQWEARYFDDAGRFRNCEYAPTPLVAAMRCYVASKLGGEVEIPEELLK